MLRKSISVCGATVERFIIKNVFDPVQQLMKATAGYFVHWTQLQHQSCLYGTLGQLWQSDALYTRCVWVAIDNIRHFQHPTKQGFFAKIHHFNWSFGSLSMFVHKWRFCKMFWVRWDGKLHTHCALSSSTGGSRVFHLDHCCITVIQQPTNVFGEIECKTWKKWFSSSSLESCSCSVRSSSWNYEIWYL